MIIYADMVFALNFFGDFLCLWLLSEIEGKIPLWRRVLASTFGGVYGVLCTFSSLYMLSSAIGKILAPLIMVLLCSMPKGFKTIFRQTAMLFLCSMLLSGGAELIAVNGMLKTIPVIFAISCIAVSALSVIRSKIYAKHLPCELGFMGKKVRFLGFYDSGNQLFSKTGEKIVIVGDERVLKKLLTNDANLNNFTEWIDQDRHAEVPFRGASGGVMRGIVLDYVKVDERKYDDVILAVSENELKDKLVLHSIMA